ncbi:MAG TPA: VOC family protein [Gemmataceae bacterium]|nr:VOC family protein [Gemmataceae bacterium]
MAPELYFVELTVADWPRAVAWYRDVLGLEVLLRVEADRFALLRAGGGRVALKEGQPQPGTTMLAFEVEDLAAEAGRLAALGVAVESPVTDSPEGYRRVLLRDPDGHRLCLFDWEARRC